jgi:hypothetical protein
VASSLGTLYYLAPVLHDRFDGLASLDEADKQVAEWRDAVKDGSARSGPWPGFVNIPSKIGQVADVRALAGQRREQDLKAGILLAAVCTGMMNTPTSGMWWDVSDAPPPPTPPSPCWTSPSTPSTPTTTASSSAPARSCPGLPGGRNRRRSCRRVPEIYGHDDGQAILRLSGRTQVRDPDLVLRGGPGWT